MSCSNNEGWCEWYFWRTLHCVFGRFSQRERVKMTDTPSRENTFRHGSSEWRLDQHKKIVGPHWFEVNTTLARTMALSFRAVAKVAPDA